MEGCYHTSPLGQKKVPTGPPSPPTVGGGGSILPQSRGVGARAVAHERPPLVSSQVLAVGALDGDASVFHKLKEKVLRLLSVRTHQTAAGDVPEPPAGTCGVGGWGRRVAFFKQPETSKHTHTPASTTTLTPDVVGAVVEEQPEDVVDGAVGVQGVGVLVVAHEAVLPAQDQHGPVDELHQEQFVITWEGGGGEREGQPACHRRHRRRRRDFTYPRHR